MKKISRITMFLLGILVLIFVSMNVEAAVKNCRDNGCPCLSNKDKGYMYAQVKYNDGSGQENTVALEEWLKDPNIEKGSKGYATFFYNQNSSYKNGSRAETTKITKTNSNRGYKCPGSSLNDDLDIVIGADDELSQEMVNTFEQYSCELFQSKRIYKEILQPTYLVIRILVPVIIVAMVTKDLVGAVVSQDAKEMQKAQKTMITRIILGVVIILLPTLIDAIMNMSSITFGTCGIG